MGWRFDRTTSRSIDFDYVGLMIEHEALKEQGVKVVKDALNPDNPVYIEINEFLAKLPQEYAQAMLRLAKTNLANIFGIDAMTVDQFIKDYESEPHG
jgi:tryptophanase